MKKVYQQPDLDVVKLSTLDVITTSGGNVDQKEGDDPFIFDFYA